MDLTGPFPVVLAYPRQPAHALDLIRGLRPRAVFYDYSDDYEHFHGAPENVAATERELSSWPTSSRVRRGICCEKVKPFRPDAFKAGPAVDYERFAILQGG